MAWLDHHNSINGSLRRLEDGEVKAPPPKSLYLRGVWKRLLVLCILSVITVVISSDIARSATFRTPLAMHDTGDQFALYHSDKHGDSKLLSNSNSQNRPHISVINEEKRSYFQNYDYPVHQWKNIAQKKLEINSVDPSSKKLHVVTYMFRPNDEGFANANNILLQKREKELVYSLQQNLLNPLVKTLTVIVHKPATRNFLQKLPLKEKQKLFTYMTHDVTLAGAMRYISHFLLGRVVLFLNQDVYLDEGFERINVTYLQTEDLMYALTRHYDYHIYCEGMYDQAHCSDEYEIPYVGSHDAFVMVFKQRLTEEQLLDIRVKQYQPGEENVLIWWFRIVLGYRVTNPCKVLKVLHRHCVRSHMPADKGSVRVNTGDKAGEIGMAAFTDSLL